jgi:HAD superfamily hydrolase (TIGR01490 family)
MANKRPFAVFDIDGTIIRWQLYHAIADELARSGQLDSKNYDRVRQARMSWKRRQHQGSYLQYEEALVETFHEAMKTIHTSELQRAYQTVISEYKDQVYTYTRDLIYDLKDKGYLLFAISASQDEIVKMLAEYYGFDDAGGTVYKMKGGYFTGEFDLLKSGRKPEFLKQLAAKHNATWQDSIAVGDSEGDIPMLSTVEQPIAFNPSKDLFAHAQAHGWQIVVERKNVIYQLEPGDGGYKLQA